MSYNKTIIIGNLTRQPESRQTGGGVTVASFTVAVNRKYKGEDETTFIDCTAFGGQAEFTSAYLGKGDSVIVDGRLHQEKWQDKQTGQNRSKLVVIAERVQSKRQDAQQPRQPQHDGSHGYQQPTPQPQPPCAQPAGSGDMPI